MLDPRLPGSAQAEVQFWYVSQDLGKDFVQQLFSQQVAVDRDDLALTNAVAQGKYAIGLGLNGYNAVALRSNGVPLEFISSSSLKEGGYLTSSWGAVSLLNKAPHPNAARVYLNWLLSHEGQQAVAKASGYPSRRQDVSTDGVLDATIPTSSTHYIEINQEGLVRQRPELVDFLKSLITS
jgi:iron(III) transport system substrate-binding protein